MRCTPIAGAVVTATSGAATVSAVTDVRGQFTLTVKDGHTQ